MTVWSGRDSDRSSRFLHGINALSGGGAELAGSSLGVMARIRGICRYWRAKEDYSGGGRAIDSASRRSGDAGSSQRPPRLMDEVRRVLRVNRYSIRTEQAYCGWIVRFIRANGRRHPRDLGGREVEAFLSSLAVKDKVAASTQNQALSALLFLYREVLRVDLPWMEHVIRAKRPARLPSLLTIDEVRRLLAAMSGR